MQPATIVAHTCSPAAPCTQPATLSQQPYRARQVLDGFCAGGSLQLDVDMSGNLLMRNAQGEQRTAEMRSGAGIEDDWDAAPAEPAGVGAGGVPVEVEAQSNPMAW